MDCYKNTDCYKNMDCYKNVLAPSWLHTAAVVDSEVEAECAPQVHGQGGAIDGGSCFSMASILVCGKKSMKHVSL